MHIPNATLPPLESRNRPSMAMCNHWIIAVFVVLSGPLTAMAQSDPAIGLNEGVPVVRWTEAKNVVGQTAIVAGRVMDVGATNDKRISFINFSKTDRKAFTLVVFQDRRDRFPEAMDQAYLNKLVTVRGIVTLFNGNPQMVLASPDQITVVDQLPNSFIPSLPNYKVGSQLTVATYNVKNLFDGVDDPYFNDESTPEKPREEILRIAAVLKEMNADVVAFQEVESRGYLKKFLEVFVPELGYNEIVHFEGNDLRGIDVCLASRAPVGRVVSHRHIRFPGPMGDRSRFNRDLLQIELVPEEGDPFEIWIVHLKSNHGGREEAEPIRLAEAKEVHKILAERMRLDPGVDLLICGDFNDTIDSPTLRTIMGLEQGQRILKPLFESLPVEKRVTYNMEPYREMIDFILVSPGMSKRYIPNSYVIRDGTDAESGSDHNPVYCRFQAKRGVAQSTTSLGAGR